MQDNGIKQKELSGIVSIIKPTGFTSHDVVAIMRRVFKTKKIGHTGTLDPDACGVLPICIGRATKVSDFIMNDKKEYYCGVTLGISTNTLDTSGEITESRLRIEFSPEELRGVLEDFKGEIWQTPPMFSAIKIGGQKLVDLARKGKAVDLSSKKRKVNIYSLDIIHLDMIDGMTKKLLEESREALSSEYKPDFYLKIICSKGTYVRSLCADIAQAMGTVGVMSSLVRTATGINTLENSVHIDEARNMDYEQACRLIMAVEKTLDFRHIHIPEDIEVKVKHGVKINLINYNDINLSTLEAGENFLLFGKEGFIAIASSKIEESGYKKITVDKLFC